MERPDAYKRPNCPSCGASPRSHMIGADHTHCLKCGYFESGNEFGFYKRVAPGCYETVTRFED